MQVDKNEKGKDAWWFVEIWDEKREVFKALAEHVFAFVLLICSLILFHFLFEFIHLPPKYKEILEFVDFGGIVLALVIFTLSFLYRLADDAITTARTRNEARRRLETHMRRILKAAGIPEDSIDEHIRQEIYRMKKSSS